MKITEQKKAAGDFAEYWKDRGYEINEHDESIKKEMEISVQAGELVGLLYDELLKQYINPESEESLKSLNQLCVRLVFCLYAEDAGIFGSRNKFHDYMSSFEVRDTR